MENDTDNEDEASGDNRSSSTDPVSEIASDESSEEGTSRKNGGDEGLLPGGKRKGVLFGIRSVWSRRLEAGVEGDEVVHAHDSGNITGIEAEEDTTK